MEMPPSVGNMAFPYLSYMQKPLPQTGTYPAHPCILLGMCWPAANLDLEPPRKYPKWGYFSPQPTSPGPCCPGNPQLHQPLGKAQDLVGGWGGRFEGKYPPTCGAEGWTKAPLSAAAPIAVHGDERDVDSKLALDESGG